VLAYASMLRLCVDVLVAEGVGEGGRHNVVNEVGVWECGYLGERMGSVGGELQPRNSVQQVVPSVWFTDDMQSDLGP
jgi:hypothetical protein